MLNHRTQPALSGLTLPPRRSAHRSSRWAPPRGDHRGAGVAAVAVVLLVARWATGADLGSGLFGPPARERRHDHGAARRSGDRVPRSKAVERSCRLRRPIWPGPAWRSPAKGMPQAGRPGLELFDQPAWGMTDFTQRSQLPPRARG